jgi:hypothetical protein
MILCQFCVFGWDWKCKYILNESSFWYIDSSFNKWELQGLWGPSLRGPKFLHRLQSCMDKNSILKKHQWECKWITYEVSSWMKIKHFTGWTFFLQYFLHLSFWFIFNIILDNSISTFSVNLEVHIIDVEHEQKYAPIVYLGLLRFGYWFRIPVVPLYQSLLRFS